MTIERKAGKIGMSCDTDGQELVGKDGKVIWHDRDDFDILIADAKDNGWDIDKDAQGQWMHTCPDCI